MAFYGCFGESPEWEANLGHTGLPVKINMITDESDNSYVVTVYSVSKVNPAGEIAWSIDFTTIDQDFAAFTHFIDQSGEQLTVFLNSETSLYRLTIDSSGNILNTQTYALPEDINLSFFHIVHIVKHDDQSFGILVQAIGDPNHYYLRLDDTGLSQLAQFEETDENIEPAVFDYGRKLFFTNGTTDCFNGGTSASFIPSPAFNWVKCFDSTDGSMIYEVQSDTITAPSFIMGDKLSFAANGQLEIHDLASQELLHTYPISNNSRMLAASENGIVIYTGETTLDTPFDESSIKLVSWHGDLIWSRKATNTFPLYGTFTGGKLFISQYKFTQDDPDQEWPFPAESFETIQINASGNKINTFNHKGGPKPALELPGDTITQPAITTITSNGKPRILGYYYTMIEDPLFDVESTLVFVQQF